MMRATPLMPAPPIPTKCTRPRSARSGPGRSGSVTTPLPSGPARRIRRRSDLVVLRLQAVEVLTHPVGGAAQPLLQRDLGLPPAPLPGPGVVAEQPLHL